jgi:ketosteroid isomerase-like protein
MQKYLIVILSASVLLAAAPAAVQIDTSTAEGQVAAALRDLRIAAASDDIDGMLRFYWNDPRLVVMDPDEGLKIEGYGAWHQFLLDRARTQKTLFWRAHHRKLRTRGDNAVVTFYVTRQVRMGQDVFQRNERGTYVLKRIDKNWLIIAQHISAFPPILLFQQSK